VRRRDVIFIAEGSQVKGVNVAVAVAIILGLVAGLPLLAVPDGGNQGQIIRIHILIPIHIGPVVAGGRPLRDLGRGHISGWRWLGRNLSRSGEYRHPAGQDQAGDQQEIDG
jgi:hypothetical protein